jgi:hypothetical protein
MHQDTVNEGDPLPSIIGTAAHAWMEKACNEYNAAHGKIIWIPEAKLHITDGLDGHADAYHVPTEAVWDWKFPGQTRMAGYRKHGASDQFKAQAHCYGKGYRRLGLPVKKVVVCFLPRGDFLSKTHIWSAPFDEDYANRALERYNRVIEAVIELDVTEHPNRYKLFPKVPSPDCQFCPWFSPNLKDNGTTCGGFA